MRFSLPLVAALGTLSSAHTVLTDIYINNVPQGDATCIRMPRNPSTASGPIASPYSNPDMACGRDGGKAVHFTCPATPGSKLTFEFRGYPDYAQPTVLDDSHKGPISFYVKPVSDFDDSAAGDGWFKIWEQGYDTTTGTYATEKLIANKGFLSINLPDLPRGKYLIRSEIITLQNVTDGFVDPQFYSGCAQLYIQSDKTGSLSIPSESKATIPGHVSREDPGLVFNIYDLHRPEYIIPGPKVFFPSSGTPSKVKAVSPLSEDQGGIPDECLIVSGNWCGVEVPSYTTLDGCWASHKNCWDQADACHDTAPATGHLACEAWAEKCHALNDACHAEQLPGPPNKGQKLKQVFTRLVSPSEIPPAENSDSGGKPPATGGDPEVAPEPVPTSKSVAPTVPAGDLAGETPTSTVSSALAFPTGLISSIAPVDTTSTGSTPTSATLVLVSTSTTLPAVYLPTSVISSQRPVGTGTGRPSMPSVYLPSPPGNTSTPCSKSVRGKGKGKGRRQFRA
jgi:hypothetical protein